MKNEEFSAGKCEITIFLQDILNVSMIFYRNKCKYMVFYRKIGKMLINVACPKKWPILPLCFVENWILNKNFARFFNVSFSTLNVSGCLEKIHCDTWAQKKGQIPRVK